MLNSEDRPTYMRRGLDHHPYSEIYSAGNELSTSVFIQRP